MTFFRIVLFAVFAVFAAPAIAFEQMTPVQANEALGKGEIVLIDIRTPAEWAQTGVANGAVQLDMTSATFQNDFAMQFGANPSKKIALICRSGNRSSRLAAMMEASGLTKIVDVTGGTSQWIADCLPVEKK